MRIHQSIFLIIAKASTLIIRLAVRAFSDKFCRPVNRFFQVALYFLLLILTFDSYFALFTAWCLVVIKLNTLPITLQLALIGFPRWESFHN